LQNLVSVEFHTPDFYWGCEGVVICSREFPKGFESWAETGMEVTLELNGKKTMAKISFAKAADFAFAKNWQDSIGDNRNPIRTDTVDYAALAIKKYEASFATGKYASSLRDFTDHIASNPKVEVAAFIVLRCDWFPGSEVIGFCHFRRSWANKIVLDYLGTHPMIACPPDEVTHKVRGVGVALLYFVAQVLKQQNCSGLWGEATSLSASYYKKTFELEKVEDLINVPVENILSFMADREQEWATEGDIIAAPNQVLDEIYALEIENPPFVGTKMAVFSQSKRLAYRYLKLPYHKQLDIAKSLHFVKADATPLGREELAEVVFKAARNKGLLAALWDAVEKEYGEAMAEPNPFTINQK
jgi:hypothetical protein